MEDKKLEFLYFYFSDLKNLKKTIRSEEDAIFTIAVPKGYDQWLPLTEFQVTAGELIHMTLAAWYDLRGMKSLENCPEIHAAEIYERALQVKDWWEQFTGKPVEEVAYEKYYKLIYALDEQYEWFNDEEIQEYMADGFQKIDVELINFTQKRNKKKVQELLRSGANPDVDPSDKTDESEVLMHLYGESSLQWIFYGACFEEFAQDGYETVKEDTLYHLLSYLYGVSSSDELIRTIEPYGRRV